MTATSVEKKVNGTPVASLAEPGFDAVALAQAEAIRTRAKAEADAIKIKAAEESERQRLENEKQALANERNAVRFRREKAVEEAKIAEAVAKREETDRARAAARRKADEEQQAETQAAAEVDAAESKWRRMALGFYIVCAIVALPVQVAAFYNPHAPWLMAAPLMLEGGAWVVLKGAAAAVASHRPHWHYRLIAWLLAAIAAGINLSHGLLAFDVATAVGTAFASIAGPGVWDLHEHGRIRKRDGVLTRAERKAQRNAERAEAARKAAEEKRRAAEKKAADEAAEAARKQLAEDRENEFPDVWDEARRIAAAVGSTTDDPKVWDRAYRNIKGAEPGESIESITVRRAAEKRVQAALSGTPVSTLSKTTNAQRANQMPRAQRGPARKPPKRQPGDTQQYVKAARKQASIAAKTAAKKDQS
ncbi:hypothetical protein [Streptomyces sp. NPDC091299]|uniref:hypothetical protein n=1 Tax=Streptomyces sp. NPDC091299 TaxID=3155302 RepID=UPI003414B5B6